jgi:hypothetical protein
VFAEAAHTQDFIGTIVAVNKSVAHRVLINAHTTGAGELLSGACRVDKEGTSLALIVSVVLLEAANGSSLVGSIRALGFTVTELSIIDAFTGSTSVLVFSATRFLGSWAHLVVVDREDTGTAVGDDLIRSVLTVADTIAKLVLVDALTRFTGEFVRLTSADLVVVELVVLEAAGLVGLIRLISALSFTVTELSFDNAVTVSASPLGLWVAAASLVVVEFVVLEAASGLTLVRFI